MHDINRQLEKPTENKVPIIRQWTFLKTLDLTLDSFPFWTCSIRTVLSSVPFITSLFLLTVFTLTNHYELND